MRRSVLTLGIALSLARAAPADAITLTNGGFDAAPGEANTVTLAFDAAANRTTFTDSTAPVKDGTPFDRCSVTDGVGVCPQLLGGFLRLGDGDDTVRFANALPATGYVVVQAGDGNDRVEMAPGVPGFTGSFTQIFGDGGNDTLLGTEARDRLNGGPGDDTLIAGAGNDDLDGRPFGYDNHSQGADSLDGGAGSDVLNGDESGASVQEPDAIACGSGPEPAGLHPIYAPLRTGDEVVIGTGDSLATDCEFVAEPFVCPSAEGMCTGEGAVAARRTRLGADRVRVRPRNLGYALVRIKNGQLKRALRRNRGTIAVGRFKLTKRGERIEGRTVRFRLRRP